MLYSCSAWLWLSNGGSLTFISQELTNWYIGYIFGVHYPKMVQYHIWYQPIFWLMFCGFSILESNSQYWLSYSHFVIISNFTDTYPFLVWTIMFPETLGFIPCIYLGTRHDMKPHGILWLFEFIIHYSVLYGFLGRVTSSELFVFFETTLQLFKFARETFSFWREQ